MTTLRLKSLTAPFGMLCVLMFVAAESASAGDRNHNYGASSYVTGWKLGPSRGRDGFRIYRETGYGWQQVEGSAIKIGGSSRNPWVINNQNRIFYWNGRNWDRMPGRAIDIADGWVIGTKREHGGYAIYRWNGYDWDQAPGGAVSIGGSYERPWVINDRNQRFQWNGYDWDHSGYSGRGNSAYQSSFGSYTRLNGNRNPSFGTSRNNNRNNFGGYNRNSNSQFNSPSNRYESQRNRDNRRQDTRRERSNGSDW